jgi:hypothetical protein
MIQYDSLCTLSENMSEHVRTYPSIMGFHWAGEERRDKAPVRDDLARPSCGVATTGSVGVAQRNRCGFQRGCFGSRGRTGRCARCKQAISQRHRSVLSRPTTNISFYIHHLGVWSAVLNKLDTVLQHPSFCNFGAMIVHIFLHHDNE